MWPLPLRLFFVLLCLGEIISGWNGAASNAGQKNKDYNQHWTKNMDNYVDFDDTDSQSNSLKTGDSTRSVQRQESFFLRMRRRPKEERKVRGGSRQEDTTHRSPPPINSKPIGSSGGKQNISSAKTKTSQKHELGLEEAEDIFYKRSRNRVKSRHPFPRAKVGHVGKRPSLTHRNNKNPKRQNIQGGFSEMMPQEIGAVQSPFVRGQPIQGTQTAVATNDLAERANDLALDLAGKPAANPFSETLNVGDSQPVHRFLPGAQHRYLSKAITGLPQLQESLPLGRSPIFPWSGGPHFGGAHHLVVVNRPVKTPVAVPVPVHSQPRVVYVDRPGPMAVSKVPYPVMVPVPQPPRNFIVVHHRPSFEQGK